MFAKTVEVKGHFIMLYESYEMLIHEIREVSKDTGFQAVIYDEQENFQSYKRYWKISTILSLTESKSRTSITQSSPQILRLSRFKTISSTFRTQWYVSRLIGGTLSASSLLCSRRPLGILSHKRNLIISNISVEIHS
jgi:hypothetical protein